MPTHRFSDLYRDPLYGPDLRAIHSQTQRLGLTEADCEDCAADFLLHKLLRHKDFKQDVALRHRCARDFAHNASRTRAARAKHEVPFCLLMGQKDVAGGWEAVDCRPVPEQEIARREFWALLLSYFDKLQPLPREILRRYHLNGEAISDLALAFGKTSHAVEQTLYRAHRRLRELLTRDNIDAANLSDYLALSAYSLALTNCSGIETTHKI